MHYAMILSYLSSCLARVARLTNIIAVHDLYALLFPFANAHSPPYQAHFHQVVSLLPNLADIPSQVAHHIPQPLRAKPHMSPSNAKPNPPVYKQEDFAVQIPNIEEGLGCHRRRDQTDCIICLQGIDPAQLTLTHVGCGYAAHDLCILTWITELGAQGRHASCPHCRGDWSVTLLKRRT